MTFGIFCNVLVLTNEQAEAIIHIFVKQEVHDMINLQREGRRAKPCQVKHIRAVITSYGLTVNERE
jgi:hypothetical protein